jgi:hypothetical protein
MVLQRYLQLETIYSSQESFEGQCLCNDNFRFTEKRIPFCQETIIVSIRLQRFNSEKLPKVVYVTTDFSHARFRISQLVLEGLNWKRNGCMRGFQPFLFGLNAVYYVRKI